MIQKIKWFLTITILFMIIFPVYNVGAATVLFSQPVSSFPVNYGTSNNSFQLADNFILSNDSQIISFRFWNTLNQTSINAYFYNDNGFGNPETDSFISFSSLSGTSTFAFQPSTGFAVYEHVFDLPQPIIFEADTTYYMGLSNGASSRWSGSYGGSFWLREVTSTTTRWTNSVPGGGSGNPYNLSFELIGDPVPVPGAVWLFASGILGLAGIKIRRKK